jgi:hypothetical protein
MFAPATNSILSCLLKQLSEFRSGTVAGLSRALTHATDTSSKPRARVRALVGAPFHLVNHKGMAQSSKQHIEPRKVVEPDTWPFLTHVQLKGPELRTLV